MIKVTYEKISEIKQKMDDQDDKIGEDDVFSEEEEASLKTIVYKINELAARIGGIDEKVDTQNKDIKMKLKSLVKK